MLGFVAAVAGFTLAMLVMNGAGFAAGLPWLRYTSVAALSLLPGLVFVRFHPHWRTRTSSPNAVALATAAGVLVGVLLPELVAQALRLAGRADFANTPKRLVATGVVAFLMPYLAFVCAAEVYRKHQNPPDPRARRAIPAELDQTLDHVPSGLPVRPRLRGTVVAVALLFMPLAPAMTLWVFEFPWHSEDPTSNRVAVLFVHAVGFASCIALGFHVLSQLSTRLAADGVSQWSRWRRVAMRWDAVDRVVWQDGLLELWSRSIRLRINPRFFTNAAAIWQMVKHSVRPEALTNQDSPPAAVGRLTRHLRQWFR
jgi:hypothetical protein